MIHIELSLPKLCLLLRYNSNIFKDFSKLGGVLQRRFQNLADGNLIKFCTFLDAAQLVLHVRGNPKVLCLQLYPRRRINS